MAEEVTAVVAPAYANTLNNDKTIRDFLVNVLTGTSKNGLFLSDSEVDLCAEVDIVWAGNEYWIAYKPAKLISKEDAGTEKDVVGVANYITLQSLSQFIASGFSIRPYDAESYAEGEFPEQEEPEDSTEPEGTEEPEDPTEPEA